VQIFRTDGIGRIAIESQADNLRRLEALHIDCGEKDQFNLLYGARRLARRLNELGIGHRYEEFPDNHTGVDYRMDESLPFSCAGAVRRMRGSPTEMRLALRGSSTVGQERC
jgi:hypothetical protein